jgi:hypothetical protein
MTSESHIQTKCILGNKNKETSMQAGCPVDLLNAADVRIIKPYLSVILGYFLNVLCFLQQNGISTAFKVLR